MNAAININLTPSAHMFSGASVPLPPPPAGNREMEDGTARESEDGTARETE